ncbi:MAG TPA: sulfite exporter TauE/SafE family protein [Chloroflexaceae bacterium]|nr:sulfite exporter TauE/SafE family protein [Chloroflexaceae bacterium]
MTVLIVGGLVVLGASLLGGITGFGFALVCTPLLLSLGLPLSVVVVTNLCLALVTRISVAYRLRGDLELRRVALLVGASLPGILLGSWTISVVEPRPLKIAAGAVVMLATLLIARSLTRPPAPAIPGATAAAGALAGFMGATTSLNGIPPVLLLARDRVSPRRFQANLALFFIGSNLITLAVLAAQGAPIAAALLPRGLVWLPIALAGNLIGVRLGTRLPDLLFRRIALAVAFVAGALAVVTA